MKKNLNSSSVTKEKFLMKQLNCLRVLRAFLAILVSLMKTKHTIVSVKKRLFLRNFQWNCLWWWWHWNSSRKSSFRSGKNIQNTHKFISNEWWFSYYQYHLSFFPRDKMKVLCSLLILCFYLAMSLKYWLSIRGVPMFLYKLRCTFHAVLEIFFCWVFFIAWLSFQ